MTKEELREDPVLEQLQRALSFGQQHARWLVAGVLVAAAVVIGILALQRGRQSAEREGSRYLIEAQAAYLTGNYAAAETQLKEMLQSHGRTRAAATAQVTLGDALMALGRPEEALKAYEAGGGKAAEPMIRAAALRGQATAQEDLGRHAEASQLFEKAAAETPLARAADLIAAARTALQAGDAARAGAMLDRAKEADRASENTAEISAYRARVEAAQAM
jgi:tetratricopeptide (TPR) repeat protein